MSKLIVSEDEVIESDTDQLNIDKKKSDIPIINGISEIVEIP